MENVFFSPLSIALALSMLAEGAKGSTSAELSKLLAIGASRVLQQSPSTFSSALLLRYWPTRIARRERRGAQVDADGGAQPHAGGGQAEPAGDSTRDR